MLGIELGSPGLHNKRTYSLSHLTSRGLHFFTGSPVNNSTVQVLSVLIFMAVFFMFLFLLYEDDITRGDVFWCMHSALRRWSQVQRVQSHPHGEKFEATLALLLTRLQTN